MTNPVAGYSIKQDSELARQAFIINLDQLEQIKEDHTKGKFFDNFIGNFTDIGDAIRSSRFY